MKACLDAKILQSRQAPHVDVNELELATASSKNMPPFVPLTNPSSHKMAKEFQLLMQHKSGSHFWPSTSAATQFEEALAFQYLMGCDPGVHQHQLSCLAGPPGSVLICQKKSIAVMVLAKATSGFTGWILEIFSMEVENQPGIEQFFFRPVDRKSAMVLMHITSTDDWLSVPCQPCLENVCGALILEKVGDAIPLVRARVLAGLDLTVKETKDVLHAFGVQLPGAPSKAACYKALIEMHTENEQEAKECLDRANVKLKEEDEEDRESDYEELLNLLEEDLGNRNDPDIKQEKTRLKRKKMQKPKVPEDGHVTLEPPKRGRGRGKGRGKGKRGRGGGKGKGKGGRKATPA